MLHHAAAVQRSFDGLASALGVTQLDLCLLDWSAAAGGATDALPAPVAAAWAGLEALVDAKSVRAAGVAHAGWRGIDHLLAACRVKPVVNACELHPLLSQARHTHTHRRHDAPPLAVGHMRLLARQHPHTHAHAHMHARHDARCVRARPC